MCRLLAQISARPSTAFPLLAEGRCSLLAQSDWEPQRRQRDGWGIAHYPEGCKEPVVVKSPGAAFEEAEAFKKAAEARGRIVIGHLRAASNPKGLPKPALIGPENTQPFSDGRYAFAHNGVLNDPDAVASRLGPLRPRVRGVNDSEVFFYQFLKFLHVKGDPFRAFEACLEELADTTRPGKRPHHGLNVAASDGEALFALCHHPESKSKAFCSDAPWGRMFFSDSQDRLALASERIEPSWKPFEDLQALVAWPSQGRIKFELRPVRLPRGLQETRS